MKFKKIFLLPIILIAFILSLFVYTKYFLTNKEIKNFIQTNLYKATKLKVDYNNFKITYKNGISFDFNNLIIHDNVTGSTSKIGYLSFTLDILPLFSKSIILNDITLYNSYIKLQKSKTNNSKNKTSTSKEKKKWHFLAKNINIKNLQSKIIIPSHKINFSILTMNLKDFSLDKKFSFNLKSFLTVDNKKGKINASGFFYLPKSEVNAKIDATNLNLNFLQKYGIAADNCIIKGNLTGHYLGDSELSLKINNIQLRKFNNLNHKLFVKIDYNFSNNNVNIKNAQLAIDDSVKITSRGFVKNFETFNLSMKTEPISMGYIKQFVKKENGILLNGKGEFILDNLTLAGNFKNLGKLAISAKFNIVKCNAVCKSYPVKGLSFTGNFKNGVFSVKNLKLSFKKSKINKFNITYKNGWITGNGNMLINVADLPVLEKKLALHKGLLNVSLSEFKIPVKNFQKMKLKYKGSFIFNNGLISYDMFKKIFVKNLKGTFNHNRITLKKGNVTFGNVKYKLWGTVAHYMKNPVKINFNISSDTFDEFIARNLLKLNISGCNNLDATVNLIGKIDNNGFKIHLNSGNVKFKNSKVNIYNYSIDNITGVATLKNNIVNIKNLFFSYNKGNYSVKGFISSPFKNHSINLTVSSNVLDEKIGNIIHINRLENLSILANLTGSFNELQIKSANVSLNGTNLIYDKYNVKNLKGNVSYVNNVADLEHITCSLNKINYLINGKIFYPFENLSYSLHILTHKIDSMFLKKANINLPTIGNLSANINISGKIGKRFSIIFDKSFIKLNKSDIGAAKSITGEIILCKNKVEFNNIKGKFFKGDISLNGYLTTDGPVKKGYFSLNGEHFDFTKINEKKVKAKKKKKGEKENFIKKIYDFCKKINIHATGNFEDIKSTTQLYKNVVLDLTLDRKGILIKNCFLSTAEKGYFKVKKGYLRFGKVNKFILDINYDNINIGDILDFLIPRKNFEFYGKAENCIFKIESKFKDFKEFEKGLNGKFNLNYKDGFVNKVSTVANIFSILNITQIFKFKLPDLNEKGFNYHQLKGNFTIKNGIISTKALKLQSDSINLIYFGDINLVKKEYNAHLAVYPLKTVDTILKYIPLIGYLFKDKKGYSGVVVTYFSIKGPLDKPSISLLPANTVTKKVGNILENLIKLPFSIITKPGDVLIPGKE